MGDTMLIRHFDLLHKQLTHCRLLSLWANEPEALFRRTEMMSILAFFGCEEFI